MKKLLLAGLTGLAMALGAPVLATAEVGVSINISLPPALVFAAPPQLVVIPETNVYAVPDLDVDVFFYSGWWWRPWEGHWYRSRTYNSGWNHYQKVPPFYSSVPSGWRNEYRDKRWRGQQWHSQRIPHQDVRRNWRNWEKDKHWEKQNAWGVQGLQLQKNYPSHSREVQPQHAEPQYRDQHQQSKPRHERHDQGKKHHKD